MSVLDVSIANLDGTPADLGSLADRAVLVVNVASKCGLTPQYEGLERLQKRYAERGFTVLGVPCNQFMGQEPGSPAEIAEFCSATYGVTFPLTEKIDVNGEDRHPPASPKHPTQPARPATSSGTSRSSSWPPVARSSADSGPPSTPRTRRWWGRSRPSSRPEGLLRPIGGRMGARTGGA